MLLLQMIIQMSDISLRVLDLTGVDGFMEFYAYDNVSMSCDTFESKEDVVADDYSDSDIISLRLLDLTDVDDFMECYADDNVSMYYSCDPFESKENAMQYIADFIITHPWTRAICLNGKGRNWIRVNIKVLGQRDCHQGCEDGGVHHLRRKATFWPGLRVWWMLKI
ncbi:hypothetical protein KY290_037553 [Solanum tuberosum]|uniref:Uncharacterized protein n=1 Tax=Solanum tuberosum TaxID=4113 RepID=A0ABQ7TX98_SOLTU|nr:hypothetical protein KY290_037553 [Solanum tuberosum]